MTTQLKLAYDVTIFNGSSFNLLEGPSRGVGERAITKYLYDRSKPNAVDLAVELIARIKNAGLRLTFSSVDASIRKEVEINPYLIIHGSAVSLAPTPGAPKDVSVKHIDLYFSVGWLEEPVCCSKGHYMEKKRAQHWVTYLQDNKCPAGDHPIGPIVVDEEHQYEVRNAKEAWDETVREKENSLDQTLQITQIAQQITTLAQELITYRDQETLLTTSLQKLTISLQKITTSLQKAELIDKSLIIGGAAVKLGGRSLCILASSNVASRFFNAATNNSLQPSLDWISDHTFTICCFTSVAFGMYRLSKHMQGYKKEKAKAFGEIASGMCNFIPTWGVPLAMVIEAGLLYKDYKAPTLLSEIEESTAEPLNQNAAQETVNLEDAYRVLKLDPASNPTKEQVEAAYKKLAPSMHPDHVENVSANKKIYTMLMATLTEAKRVIFEQKNWT
jgi:hypothetical protein